jgi:hypothetical protein
MDSATKTLGNDGLLNGFCGFAHNDRLGARTWTGWFARNGQSWSMQNNKAQWTAKTKAQMTMGIPPSL